MGKTVSEVMNLIYKIGKNKIPMVMSTLGFTPLIGIMRHRILTDGEGYHYSSQFSSMYVEM